ncbi:hypothetical protein ACHAPJ_009037 [Fusarium lateritium]
MANQPPRSGYVWIKTTLTKEPYDPLEERPTFKTERLLLKPFYEGAAEDLFPMRLQPEVMKWTSQGVPDKGLNETKQWVALRLAPHHRTNFSFVISLVDTGEVIGTGGCYRRVCELGWPEVGYAFRKEAWGKGFATEFLRAFLEIWWKLPRVVTWVEVDQVTLSSEELAADSSCVVTERIGAVTFRENDGSQNVLQKAGFQRVNQWSTSDGASEKTFCGWIYKQNGGIH